MIHLAPPAIAEYSPDMDHVTSGRFFTVHSQLDAIVNSVKGARQNYQSYPTVASQETVIELRGLAGHWRPIRVPTWRNWDVARIVTAVCNDPPKSKLA